MESCNSHYLSHFAAFFIVARAKRSVVKSCLYFFFICKINFLVTENSIFWFFGLRFCFLVFFFLCKKKFFFSEKLIFLFFCLRFFFLVFFFFKVKKKKRASLIFLVIRKK